MKPKQNKFKEIHTQTDYNQTIKSQNQRENLESGKREVTHYIQEILNKINRNHENNETRYLKFQGEKRNINQEFCVQENYPSKMRNKLTNAQINKTTNSLLEDLPYKKY